MTHSLNPKTARLWQNDSQRRRVLADIADKLRTPLTVMHANFEGMLDGAYPLDRVHLESASDETQQLARLIEDWRRLALADAGALHLARQATDLALLIHESRVVSYANRSGQSDIAYNITAARLNVNVDPAHIR